MQYLLYWYTACNTYIRHIYLMFFSYKEYTYALPKMRVYLI
mgnify:CR=1 FL=1